MIKSGDELSVRILDSLNQENFMSVNELQEKLAGVEVHNIYSGLAKLHEKHLVEKKQLPGELLQFKKNIN